MADAETDIRWLPQRMEELHTRRVARLEGCTSQQAESDALRELADISKILFERFYEYKEKFYNRSM